MRLPGAGTVGGGRHVDRPEAARHQEKPSPSLGYPVVGARDRAIGDVVRLGDLIDELDEGTLRSAQAPHPRHVLDEDQLRVQRLDESEKLQQQERTAITVRRRVAVPGEGLARRAPREQPDPVPQRRQRILNLVDFEIVNVSLDDCGRREVQPEGRRRVHVPVDCHRGRDSGIGEAPRRPTAAREEVGEDYIGRHRPDSTPLGNLERLLLRLVVLILANLVERCDRPPASRRGSRGPGPLHARARGKIRRLGRGVCAGDPQGPDR